MNNQDQSFISEFIEIPHQNLNPESKDSLAESKSVRPLLQSQSQAQSIVQSEHVNQPIPEPQQDQASQSSYLNISFQEIINLIINNESPHLISALKSSLRKSNYIFYFLLVYTWLEILFELVSLYFSQENRKANLYFSYFILKVLADSLLMYSLYQLIYIVKEGSQIGQGDISHQVIEYLKFTIRYNSPFDEEEDEDDQLTQAQWVARSIASKIDTFHLLNYLLNHYNSHTYAVNRLIYFSQSILFIWGGSMILQELRSELDLVMFGMIVSVLMGFIVLVMFSISLLIICFSIPILICLLLWQSCVVCFACVFLQRIIFNIRMWNYNRRRNNFMSSLRVLNYRKFKEEKNMEDQVNDDCVICLGTYEMDEQIIQLPCNVRLQNGQQINHFFHENCIRTWIEEQGNCPICRKRFIEMMRDD